MPTEFASRPQNKAAAFAILRQGSESARRIEMRKSAVIIGTAAEKNFHKIFTFEQARRFFKVLIGALLISDYARASFFVQRNRVTFDEADWNFWKRRA